MVSPVISPIFEGGVTTHHVAILKSQELGKAFVFVDAVVIRCYAFAVDGGLDWS